MAAKTSWYGIDNALGINFNQSYASVVAVAASVLSTGNIDQSEQLVASDALGIIRKGSDDSEWVLLKASTTITQFMVVCYDDSYNANSETSALALAGNKLALCQVQTYGGVTAVSVDPAANPVFWAMVRGTGAQVYVSGSAGTGVAINSGTAAGQVSISTTGTAIHGIVLLASTGASTNVECMVLYPHAGAFS